MKRYLLFSAFLTLFYFIFHISLAGSYDWKFIPINLTVSFIYFVTICLFWHIGEQYKWGRIINVLASIFFILPLAQIPYFLTYKSFIASELYVFLVRELNFLWGLFLMVFSWVYVTPALVALIANYYLIRYILKIRPRKIDYLFLFKKWYLLIPLAFIEYKEVTKCLAKRPERIIEKGLVPIFLFFLISVLVQAIISKRPIWKKAVFISIAALSLAINITFSKPPLSLIRDKSTFDTRFFQSTYAALLGGNFLKDLSPGKQYHTIFNKIPKVNIDYNIVVIILDTLRYDVLKPAGKYSEADTNLHWFYDQAHIFDYPVAMSNMTAPALVSMFTGLGTHRSVSNMKNSLRFWDYFKGANTFYFWSAEKHYAKINKFLETPGLNILQDTDNGSVPTSVALTEGDAISRKALQQYLSKTKSPFVGVWHLAGTHSHYKFSAPDEYKIFKFKHLKDKTERFRLNYFNSVHFSTSMTSIFLKSIDLDNTVVVFMGDHGEAMGEHGYFYHNQFYNQEVARVPFMWHIPARLKKKIPKAAMNCFRKNQKSVVSYVDLIPTLLSMHKHLTGEDRRFNPYKYDGQDLFRCQDKERIVYASHCITGYRCFKRNILFASNQYSILFDGKVGIEGLYATLDDVFQETPIALEKVRDKENFKRFIENTSKAHPVGKLLKKYIENN